MVVFFISHAVIQLETRHVLDQNGMFDVCGIIHNEAFGIGMLQK